MKEPKTLFIYLKFFSVLLRYNPDGVRAIKLHCSLMSYSQAKKAPIPPHTLTVSSNRKTLKPSELASPRIMRSNVKGAEEGF